MNNHCLPSRCGRKTSSVWSGLATGTAIGVDLRWWSAERQDHGTDTGPLQWVKTLQGRFILKGQDGLSRPRFFKIEPAEEQHAGTQLQPGAWRINSSTFVLLGRS